MSFDLGSNKNKIISDHVLKEVAIVGDFPKKSFKFDFHVHALEEELKKIEAFKRELPHCMHLLQDAIERLKEEGRREEEFAVLRNYGEGEARVKSSNDHLKNWMSCVHLCTPARNQDSIFHLKSRFLEGEGSGKGSGVEFGCKFMMSEGGAFLPFNKKATSGVDVMKEKQGTGAVEGLPLAVPESDDSTMKVVVPVPERKKQRRCWSPELHKIFVHALHHLGGAHTATPKQIRELMKVEGLTNDEVKSHLQKYRIHIKRVDTASSNLAGPLHDGKASKGGCAATGGESIIDEGDDKSEGHHGWKSKLHN